MTTLNFPASPSIGQVEELSNGLQYHFDGTKWVSQGTHSTASLNTLNFSRTGSVTGQATSRSVANKLQDFVSVKDFGAKGDGSTDDTNAFKDAIATGKTVLVPKGNPYYKITDTLTMSNSHQGLIGDKGLSEIWLVLATNVNKPAIAVVAPTPPNNATVEYVFIENLYIKLKRNISGTPMDKVPNYNHVLTEDLAGVVVSGNASLRDHAVQNTRLENIRLGNFAIGFYFTDVVSVSVYKCWNQNLVLFKTDENGNPITTTADGRTIPSRTASDYESTKFWGVGYYFDATTYAQGAISPLASIEIVETDENRGEGDPDDVESVSYLVIGGDPRDIFLQRTECSHSDYGWYIDGGATTVGSALDLDLNWDIQIFRPVGDQIKINGIYLKRIAGVGSVTVNGGYFVGNSTAKAAIQIENSNGVVITGGTQILGLTNETLDDNGVFFKDCSSCSVIGNRFANLSYAISLENSNFCTVQGNIISGATAGVGAAGTAIIPKLVDAIRVFGDGANRSSSRNSITGNTIRGSDTAPVSATYTQSGTTITVNKTNHGLDTGEHVYMDFDGAGTDGQYAVTKIDNNDFRVVRTSGTNASADVTAGTACTFGARYTMGISIDSSAETKNVLVGNVIDSGTVITPISNSGTGTVNANNITD